MQKPHLAAATAVALATAVFAGRARAADLT